MRVLSGGLMLLLFAPWALIAGEAEGGTPTAPPPYLVVLDFASDFDKGKMGRKVGEMARFKSARRRLFSVDAEIEWDERRNLMPSPALDEIDAAAVGAQAKEALGCDILLWGRLERPHKDEEKVVHQHEGYKTIQRTDKATRLVVHVRAIDCRRDPPALVVSKTLDLANEYALTQEIDNLLSSLAGVDSLEEIAAADPANRMVAYGPNLIPGGSMDDLVEGPPGRDWHKAFPGWHFPVKEGIAYEVSEIEMLMVTEDGDTIGRATLEGCLKYALTPAVAGGPGLFCYTPYVPIEPETYYQASFRVNTEGPAVIMFVKGYRDLPVKGIEGMKTHRQEVFKHQKRFYGKKGEWGTLTTQPFLPRSHKPEHMPQFLRIQLYAYHPAGVVRFDDVELRPCRLPEPEPPE